jgi:hypothetical protein
MLANYWVDVVLSVLAASCQIATGYLGWRVTVDGHVPEGRGKLYERLIICFGLAGILTTGMAAYRSAGVSKALDALLEGQHQQGETLSNIQGKIRESRAIVQFDAWDGPFTGPTRKIQLNGTLKNHGDIPAVEGISIRGTRIVPFNKARTRQAQMDVEESLWVDLIRTGDDRYGDITLGPDQHVIQPIEGTKISQKQADDINGGRVLVFFALNFRYKDDHTGKMHETHACKVFWGHDPAVLHECFSGHNDSN